MKIGKGRKNYHCERSYGASPVPFSPPFRELGFASALRFGSSVLEASKRKTLRFSKTSKPTLTIYETSCSLQP